ncbi:hypothetical protein D9M72_101760 [compost metagenome]
MDLSWNLVCRKPAPTEIDNFALRGIAPLGTHDESRRQFALQLVGDTSDSSNRHPRVLTENSFEFGGINIESASDDHVFQSVYDKNIAVAVLVCQVSGMEPTVRIDGLSRSIRAVQIASHRDGPLYQQLTDLPIRERYGGVSGLSNSHVYAR